MIDSDIKYPKINENLLENDFDLIILPSEPYAFTEKNVMKFKNIYPEKQIIRVDGEMFSWYGTHQLIAIKYLQEFVEKINSKG